MNSFERIQDLQRRSFHELQQLQAHQTMLQSSLEKLQLLVKDGQAGPKRERLHGFTCVYYYYLLFHILLRNYFLVFMSFSILFFVLNETRGHR